MKRFIKYLIRWQMSSPLLALVLYIMNTNVIIETIIANLVGGIIFYWIDKKIFKEE